MKGKIKNIGENVDGDTVLKIIIPVGTPGADQIKLGEMEITYSKTKQGKLIDDSDSGELS